MIYFALFIVAVINALAYVMYALGLYDNPECKREKRGDDTEQNRDESD